MNYHLYVWDSIVQQVTQCLATSSLPILFNPNIRTAQKNRVKTLFKIKKDHEEKYLLLDEKDVLVGGKCSKYKFWLTTWDRHWKFGATIHAQWGHNTWDVVLPKLTLDQAGTGEGGQLGSSFLKSSLLKQ